MSTPTEHDRLDHATHGRESRDETPPPTTDTVATRKHRGHLTLSEAHVFFTGERPQDHSNPA